MTSKPFDRRETMTTKRTRKTTKHSSEEHLTTARHPTETARHPTETAKHESKPKTTRYKGEEVEIVREAQPGDTGFEQGADQVAVRTKRDPHLKLVKRSELS